MADHIPAGLDGFFQGTGRLADISAQHLVAFFADGLATAHPGNILGRPVERSNPEIHIHGKSPIGNGVEDEIPQKNFLAHILQ